MRDHVGQLGRQTVERLNRYADQSALFYRILRQIVVNPRSAAGAGSASSASRATSRPARRFGS